MNNNIYDTVIIGSGPAGLTAAIYNIRADMKTIVLAGNQPGGQLMMTTTVDNWPGYANGTGGVKLMMEMQAQVTNLGGEIRQGNVKSVRALEPKSFSVTLEDGTELQTKAVIVATGAKAKWLGIEKENELIGKGVSGCATCDGMFFRDKVVAVVGGGDTACEDADFLTKFATKVYLIHRRDSLRASVVEQKRVLNNPKIEMVWNSEVVGINSNIKNQNSKLEDIKIKNNKTNEESVLLVDGLFMAIGHNPATEFVAEMVERDEEGHVVTGKNQEYGTMTSYEGIFAAGDCTTMNKNYKQAIAAAGDGCKAALDAEKWIKIER
jgi:thioredoxin reductase (NADPH)